MPYVKMEVTKEGVTREQKAALVKGVTTLLHQVLNKDPSLTFVTLDEIETDNWGVGGELVSDLRRKKAAAPSPAPIASPSVLADTSGELPALLDCIATYLDGLYFADVERLSRVFHPRARYFSTAEGSLKELDMPTYFDVVRGRVPASASQQPRYDRLLSVDLAGPHTAMVKLECALAPRHFTDYLSLVKDEGQWRIISKVFEARPLPRT
ncbi:2-hydroxymuconate tautomerase family protein [Myxococcus stipitatus]|uniref:2-hydroxymuconate tautomerase family protein n=1 Tax=Myxococcus stipitatus TaxID=83455 RepID=UPI0031452D23